MRVAVLSAIKAPDDLVAVMLSYEMYGRESVVYWHHHIPVLMQPGQFLVTCLVDGATAREWGASVEQLPSGAKALPTQPRRLKP